MAQENEAEKTFRDVEKKLLAAAAFEVHFTYQASKQKARGQLLVTRDNRVRLQLQGGLGGEQITPFELVSDGKRIRTRGAKLSVMPSGLPAAEPGGQSEWQTPKEFHKALGHTVSRGGMWFTVFVLPYLCGEGAREGGRGLSNPDQSKMKVYDFKLGAEKVGGRQTKVLRYRLGQGDGDRHDEEIALWLDGQTLLPIKRSFVLKVEGTRITETYEVFQVDPRVRAGAFELPKTVPARPEEKEPPKRPTKA
jgi:hypothetical protein